MNTIKVSELPIKPKEFEEAIERIAYDAGDFIKQQLKELKKDIDVEIKSDDTPVTIVDKRVNDYAIKCLNAAYGPTSALGKKSPIHIIGEENVEEALDSIKNNPNVQDKNNLLGQGYVIYLDPIDGTKSFIQQREKGEWCVLISVAYNSHPIAGVCYIPLHDVFYIASLGNGAFKKTSRDGKRIPISCATDPSKEALLLRSSSRTNPKDDLFFKHMPFKNIDYVASFGIKACYIAEGRGSCYLNDSCSYWDSCGVQCILQEAGGTIIDTATKKPKVYDGDSTSNPHMLMVVSSTIAKEIETKDELLNSMFE